MKKIATRIFKFLSILFLTSFGFSILGLMLSSMDIKGVYYGISLGLLITVLITFGEKRNDRG